MKGWKKGLLQLLVGLAVLVAALRYLLFEAWVIPEDRSALVASVAPTLRGGDSVLVLTRGTPDKGALVRCQDPEEATRWVIGRIVAVDGDTVDMLGNKVVVNGQRFDVTEQCQEPKFTIEHPDSGAEIEESCSRVDFAGSWHFIGHMRATAPAPSSPRTVGPGMIFLLSDNRDVHDDSRDFGAIPLDSCQGSIVFRLWSREGWKDSKARLSYIR